MHAARPLAAPLLGLLALLGAACRSVTPPGTFLASDPPGAEVVVDGRRTGFVTPCLVDLASGRTREVRLELAGFEPRSILVVPSKRVESVPWRDGALSNNGMRMVFALEAEDVFLPYRIDRSQVPARLFLRLAPERP